MIAYLAVRTEDTDLELISILLASLLGAAEPTEAQVRAMASLEDALWIAAENEGP